MKMSDFAKERGIDPALLMLLAKHDHVPVVSNRGGHYRLDPEYPLSAEDAETRAREIYDALLENIGQKFLKR